MFSPYLVKQLIHLVKKCTNLIIRCHSLNTNFMRCDSWITLYQMHKNSNRKSVTIIAVLTLWWSPLISRLVWRWQCLYNKTYLGSRLSDCYNRGRSVQKNLTFKDGRGSIRWFSYTVFGCRLDKCNIYWSRTKQNNNIAGIFGSRFGQRASLCNMSMKLKGRHPQCKCFEKYKFS